MSKIKIDELRKEFDVPEGIEVAVDSISFDLNEGEFVTLVGPSGCGKTTTLRCIAGLEIPTSGTIEFDGVDVTDVPASNRELAMMFQNIALYPHMSIIDNIAYPLKVDGVPKEERYEQAREAAEIMRIPNLLDKYPGELSGGQRQRAALARTIVQDPVAFLMDEPLSDLDAKLKVNIRKEIQRVHKRLGKPTFYVTHDQEEAMTMSDRIAVMNDGMIEQIGTRDEVYNYPANKFVAQFIGNPSMNFFEGIVQSVTEEQGEIIVFDQPLRFTTDRLEQSIDSEAVTVGVRPQGINLFQNEEGSHFRGELQLLEPIDDRALATIDGPDGEIRAIVPSENSLSEGELVSITLDTGDLYCFDPNSDELVAKSGGQPSEQLPTQE